MQTKLMKLCVTVFGLLTLVSTSGQAALGWTLDQCRQFYGPVYGKAEITAGGRIVYSFQTKRFCVGVVFHKGEDSASRIIYIKRGKNGQTAKIDLDVVKQLLDANIDGEYELSEPMPQSNGDTDWIVTDRDGIKFACSIFNDGAFAVWTASDDGAAATIEQAQKEISNL